VRRILALPLAGLLLLVVVIANEIGISWIFNRVVHVLAAEMLALALLLRIIAMERCNSLKATANWPLVATSASSFISAAWIMHYLQWSEWNTTRASLFAAVGCIAGSFSYFRIMDAVRWCSRNPTAVCIAVVIGISPLIFYSCAILLWQWTAGTTVAIVTALLRLRGVTVTSKSVAYPGHPGFDIGDNLVSTIQSADFQLNIAKQCSGLEGELLFCFLISVFLLYDWRLFGKTKKLGVVYLLVIPIMLGVNAVRIASIFLYMDWAQAHKDAALSIQITKDTFHFYAGLVLYTAVFALTLPLLYRWAIRQSNIIRLLHNADAPTNQ